MVCCSLRVLVVVVSWYVLLVVLWCVGPRRLLIRSVCGLLLFGGFVVCSSFIDVRCLLLVACWLLLVVRCLLFVVCWLMVDCCLLFDVLCLLLVVCCLTFDRWCFGVSSLVFRVLVVVVCCLLLFMICLLVVDCSLLLCVRRLFVLLVV